MKQAVLHRKALSTQFLEGLAKSGEPGDRGNRGQSAVNTISSVPRDAMTPEREFRWMSPPATFRGPFGTGGARSWRDPGNVP